MKITTKLIILISALFISSCATIPKQAPSLSEELGIKINSLEKSHINLLHSFFNQKREIVDEFIIKEWVPAFTEEFFTNQTIKDAWEEIVSSNNKEDRTKFLTMLTPKLQNKINSKRIELIKPLDNLERELEYKIRNEYNIARSINNSLTGFLYSASKVDENRKRYLEMLGVTDEKIDNALSKTDSLVNQLVKHGNVALEKEQQIESYLKQLEEINKNLNNNPLNP
ncbi:MAG: hypothetical protein KAG95_06145 [Bacteroidales bacterium]|nr:hypothetical protein [Bacteroidales bacterium]